MEAGRPGLWGRAGPDRHVPGAGPHPAPRPQPQTTGLARAPRVEPRPACRGRGRAGVPGPRATQPQRWLPAVPPTATPHPAAALTPVCVYEVQHPLGGGAGSLVNGRTVSPRSRRPVRVGPEEPLGVCKAGRPAVQPQALQAGTFHPKSPATGAGRAAEGTGPRGHALGSPARASQRFLVENSFMLFSEPINSVLSMNLTRCDVCFCDS